MKSVVVTGVSTGIGWGAAKVLTAAGYRVFGSVRKAADAQRLSAEFGENFTPMIFDVTDEAAVGAARRWPARLCSAWSTTPASPCPAHCWSCRSPSSASRSRSIWWAW